jgi:hypothetical protein
LLWRIFNPIILKSRLRFSQGLQGFISTFS